MIPVVEKGEGEGSHVTKVRKHYVNVRKRKERSDVRQDYRWFEDLLKFLWT